MLKNLNTAKINVESMIRTREGVYGIGESGAQSNTF